MKKILIALIISLLSLSVLACKDHEGGDKEGSKGKEKERILSSEVTLH